jgi:hypothetical protein
MHEPSNTATKRQFCSTGVLEMIKCGCSKDTHCSTSMCVSYKAHLPCTMFYGCHGDVNCRNKLTRRIDIVDDCDSGDLSED